MYRFASIFESIVSQGKLDASCIVKRRMKAERQGAVSPLPGIWDTAPGTPLLLHCQASCEGGDARGGHLLAWGLRPCPRNSSPLALTRFI